ncbi:DUF3788 domain-containing protein [Flavobacterium sp. AS60]|uniref:DUF3788 domain-containing protein n=1 Tax=Flavobacterium anseongense TaxID=2910677 RepID=UPI001F1AE157|nr:DUF3788 domain-containing protein [Flavobacterium sp. AS60]MCF6130464.1 DUF3788 domain-containing protein [Flavobacterium sp. AS60]
MKSIFIDKNNEPTLDDLKKGLGNTFDIWTNFEAFAIKNYPNAKAEWNFSGEKFGWSYRVKDAKRVLIYLLPRDNFFKTAFVFGQKATEQIFESDISEVIKQELKAAKVYAEGRGIRIEVRDKSNLEDIQKMIKIKIMN